MLWIAIGGVLSGAMVGWFACCLCHWAAMADMQSEIIHLRERRAALLDYIQEMGKEDPSFVAELQ